jgi:hypothetical protein
MISGSMPRWRRNLNRFASGFMCLWFAGLAFIGIRMDLGAASLKSRLFISGLFLAMAVSVIVAQLRFHRKSIVDFSCDGSTLQYRTLGSGEPQLRSISELKAIKELHGRGGSFGYRLRFHDGEKLYLEFAVTNSFELASVLRGACGIAD